MTTQNVETVAHAPCGDCGAGRRVGFVVLTDQPDRSWKDDWDGEVHVTAEDALGALNEARSALSREGVMLVSLHVVVGPDT